MSRDRITIATDMARERREAAGLGNGILYGHSERPDGSVRIVAALVVSAADIDAQIDLLRERGVERDSAPATSAPGTDAHGRLTDARIAELLEDALALGGCFEMNECDAAAVLLELQQRRARIVAHAAAHPERLSDDHLANRLAHINRENPYLLSQLGDDERRAIIEIQQRRAADLKPDEIETVREMLLEFEANDSAWEDGCDDVIAVCRKLLRSHGARP